MQEHPQQKGQEYIELFVARLSQHYNSRDQWLVEHGMTKACKSTFATMRFGITLQSYKHKDGDIKIRIKRLDKDGVDYIGHQYQSKTIVPNFFKDCLDLPGIGDSRQLMIALINAYMKFICLKGSKKFRFAIFVHESGLAPPGNDFIRTIKTFFESFPKLRQNMDKIVSATVLVISKGTRNLQDTKAKIKSLSQMKPVQMQGYHQEYHEFLTRLSNQNKILLFEKPTNAGQIVLDNLSKEVDSRTKPITFEQGQIGSSIAIDIKESLSSPAKKREFEEYIEYLVQTIDGPINQGLQIINRFILNAFENPENLFADYAQEGQDPQNFEAKVLEFNNKHEHSLTNDKVQDFVARHNVLREKFLFEPIQSAKQANNFRPVKSQKKEATVASSNSGQLLTYDTLKIILEKAIEIQIQETAQSIYQQTNKLKETLLSIMGRLCKLMQKQKMPIFFRFCYALKNKIDWVMAGMLMLSDSQDQDISAQFSKIMLNTRIKDSLCELTNLMHKALKKKIINFKIISHNQQLSVTQILIRYFSLQMKPNEKTNVQYLDFLSQSLDNLLAKVPQSSDSPQQLEWEINLIKIRKAQVLRLQCKNASGQGKLRSAAYYAAESIYYSQMIADDEARMIAIKSRSLLARIIETAIKELYKKKEKKTSTVRSTAKVQQAMIDSKLLQDAIQQKKITFEDCLEIYKANNQLNQELRLLEEQYNKYGEQRVGIKLMKRLFECLRRQKALEIGQKIYEAAEENLERKKHINTIILNNLEKMDQKTMKFKKNIEQRENYRPLSIGFLSKFHFDMKKNTDDNLSTD